eukprot:412834-Pyramimonas_sp.AAC.1
MRTSLNALMLTSMNETDYDIAMVIYDKVCDYVVRVHTSDRRGAGTDANVFLAVYGKDAEGNALALPEWRLDNAKNNFERGMVDEFGFQCPDVGALTHARLRHDNSGMGPGWHVHK